MPPGPVKFYFPCGSSSQRIKYEGHYFMLQAYSVRGLCKSLFVARVRSQSGWVATSHTHHAVIETSLSRGKVTSQSQPLHCAAGHRAGSAELSSQEAGRKAKTAICTVTKHIIRGSHLGTTCNWQVNWTSLFRPPNHHPWTGEALQKLIFISNYV